jgi:hypothetical protein
MTRSSGRPGGGRPGSGRPGGGRPDNRPSQKTEPPQQEDWDARPTSGDREPVIQVDRPEIGKRGVALLIDVGVSYLVAMVVQFIPFVNNFLNPNVTMVLFLLCRDFLFRGRGIGKNFMGLQVVDVSTGEACNLLQSVQRNVIWLAPFLVLLVANTVFKTLPIPWLNESVTNIVDIVGMVYCAIVLPMEAYRVYSRPDGIRIGDEMAGTAIIEAPMDFSELFPRG